MRCTLAARCLVYCRDVAPIIMCPGETVSIISDILWSSRVHCAWPLYMPAAQTHVYWIKSEILDAPEARPASQAFCKWMLQSLHGYGRAHYVQELYCENVRKESYCGKASAGQCTEALVIEASKWLKWHLWVLLCTPHVPLVASSLSTRTRQALLHERVPKTSWPA